jgi:choline dehydrogenase-like flavoprotein
VAEYRADIVIVGAGVAGLLVAWKLAQAGVKVLVLEAGPRVNRAEALENYRNAVAKVPESPYPDVPHAPRPTVLSLRDGYYIQDGPDTFGSTYERRVGGTTWHWLGTCVRHLPNDFRIKSLYGVAEDWPIGYDDLEPWYYQADLALGVSGDNHDEVGSPRPSGPFPQPPLPPTYLDRQIAEAIQPLGWSVHVNAQARNSQTYDGRPPCCGNATCVPICPIAAKYDGAVHATKAEQLGAQILENAVASFVEVGPEGQVTGIRFKRPDNSEDLALGRIYVLAGNAMETPKLLLISRSDALPNGVANTSDQVGRNLMDHPVQLSWALANEPVFPYRSPLENAAIHNFRDGPERSRRAAFLIAIGEEGWSFPGITPIELTAELLKEGFRGAALREEMDRRVARQYRFANLIEQMPDPENRIVPAFDQPDAIGIPRPKITYRLDDLTKAGMAEARRVSEQIFNAMGSTSIQHSEFAFGAGHIMGTYRMGTDPSTSVVDPDSRAHDHPNLYLLGSGVFPSVGTGNPTLTIAALSLRAAETIRARLQQ